MEITDVELKFLCPAAIITIRSCSDNPRQQWISCMGQKSHERNCPGNDPRNSEYSSSRDYFRAYSVLNNAIENITVPTTIITSADDPIIPVEDFFDLHTNNLTNIAIQPYGGHNGFLQGLRLESWYEQQLVELFDGIVEKG